MHLTQLLHRAVQQQPRRLLTVCGRRERTAPQIAYNVARFAGALRERGVGPGDRVAILAYNSDRYFEALMATWWLGAVATLINRNWSATEVADAMSGVGSTCLLVDEQCLPLVDGLDSATTTVYLGDSPAPAGMTRYNDLIAAGAEVADIRAGGDTLAALIYSGGTTGKPKAVMHSHHSLTISILAGSGYARSCEPGGASLVMAPLFHIAALLGMLTQTVVGGTLVFANRFDPDEVLRLIPDRGINTMTSIPSMLQILYNHPDFPNTDVTSIKSIVYGAAPMPAAILERAMAAFPNANFVQGYGMTETAVIVSLLGADHRASGARLRSAGRASLHAEVLVMGDDGEESPRGTVGEIVTRGEHVMLGYWNNPEETAAALRGGWLHTGDLGYMDDEGYIYIVDRAKDMIITGGENVYSAEVEDAIANHPAVLRCAVIGLPDPRWGERVHAVVVLASGATATTEEIRGHVKAQIAGYKAPRTVDFVDALATTATGKTDKRSMRTLYT